MALQSVLDTLDGVDSSLHEHYAKDEKSGKFVLSLTDTEAFPRVVQLRNEAGANRIKLRDTETALNAFRGLGELADIQAKLDRIPELEASAGQMDETKLEAVVKARVAPIERQLTQAQKDISDRDLKLADYDKADRRRKVESAVRAAAKKANIRSEAEDDALLLASVQMRVNEDDSVSTESGIDPVTWFQDRMKDRPHWWEPSSGGGAGGNTGGAGGAANNPFTAEHWNLTKQGELMRQDRATAERLAKAAGTTIGGNKPPARK